MVNQEQAFHLDLLSPYNKLIHVSQMKKVNKVYEFNLTHTPVLVDYHHNSIKNNNNIITRVMINFTI